MIINVEICDDEIESVNQLKEMLVRYSVQTEIEFVITSFQSPKQLFEHHKKTKGFQLIFLDVEMPGLNGIELARKIRQHDNTSFIIFVSSYPDYMQDSFEVHAYYYMKKPLCYEKLCEVCNRLFREIKESDNKKCLLSSDGENIVVDTNEILYVETITGTRNSLRIVLANKFYEIKGTLYDWEQDLRRFNFIKPHRSYLVNLKYIHKIKDGFLVLTTGHEIPYSKGKKEELRKIFSTYYITAHTGLSHET